MHIYAANLLVRLNVMMTEALNVSCYSCCDLQESEAAADSAAGEATN